MVFAVPGRKVLAPDALNLRFKALVRRDRVRGMILYAPSVKCAQNGWKRKSRISGEQSPPSMDTWRSAECKSGS